MHPLRGVHRHVRGGPGDQQQCTPQHRVGHRPGGRAAGGAAGAPCPKAPRRTRSNGVGRFWCPTSPTVRGTGGRGSGAGSRGGRRRAAPCPPCGCRSAAFGRGAVSLQVRCRGDGPPPATAELRTPWRRRCCSPWIAGSAAGRPSCGRSTTARGSSRGCTRRWARWWSGRACLPRTWVSVGCHRQRETTERFG